MSLEKITVAQMDEKGVCAAPDKLTGTAAQNKALFDRMVREIVAPAHNACVDAVNEIDEQETQWAEAEETRVTAETARVAAESDRTASEGTRQANETARVQAETARANAEAQRQTNEQLRQMAENSRAFAETQRVNAEDTRKANETARVQAETARDDAETQRQSNETTRQNAEAQRVSAENARNVWEDYDVTKFYTVGNKVVYGGSSYLCIKPCTGVNPMNGTYWRRIAAKGANGAPGERGNCIWYTERTPDQMGNTVLVNDLWIVKYRNGPFYPGDVTICTEVSDGVASWSRICSMVGEHGSVWHVGSGRPHGVVAANETDLYLDTSTADVWQFRANASTGGLDWIAVCNIKGSKGEKGAPGDAGKSAYASAQDGGYTGTEAQFNASLGALINIESVDALPESPDANTLYLIREV